MSGQSSVRKMSCQVDVMSGKCVQEFEAEPIVHLTFHTSLLIKKKKKSELAY